MPAQSWPTKLVSTVETTRMDLIVLGDPGALTRRRTAKAPFGLSRRQPPGPPHLLGVGWCATEVDAANRKSDRSDRLEGSTS